MDGIQYRNYRIDIVEGAGGRVGPVGSWSTVQVQRRSHAAVLLAPGVPVGRQALVADVFAELGYGRPVGLHGRCGCGKSTLLRHVAARATAAFGVPGVYLQLGEHDDVDDIVQRVIGRLYALDRPAKLTVEECAELLAGTGAVVALDDVPVERFGPQRVARLLQALSGCRIVLGSTDPIIDRRGTSLAVPGLSDNAALEAVAGALGRPLDGAERPAVQRLITAVHGRPLALRQAAALVAVDRHGFADLADIAERDAGELDRLAEQALEAPERRLLAVLTVTAGTLLPDEVLETIGDVQRVDEALGALRRRGLADRHEDRFGLPICQAASYRRLLYRHFDLATAVRDIVSYCAARDPSGEQCRSAVGAMLALLEYAAERGNWPAVASLARLAQQVLILAGRWHAAGRALELGRQAADAIGDLAAQAFFAHQQGTLALCQGDLSTAHWQLSQALKLREQLGDSAGAQVTRNNLTLAVPSPPPASQPRPRDWRRLRRPLSIIGMVMAIVVAVVTIVDRAGGIRRAESPPPPSATATPIPSPHTTSPTPGTGHSGGPEPNQSSPSVLLPPRIDGAADFRDVLVNTIGTLTLKVVNPNPQAITLAGLTITASTDFGAFAITPGGCRKDLTLAFNQSCEITVTFSPTRMGAHEATLSVSNRDGGGASSRLRGTGSVRYRIYIEGPGIVQLSDRDKPCIGTVSTVAGRTYVGDQTPCLWWVAEHNLTATAVYDKSKYYVSWDGACKPAGNKPECTLYVTNTTSVTAKFINIVE